MTDGRCRGVAATRSYSLEIRFEGFEARPGGVRMIPAAYAKAFPELFAPDDEVSDELRAHFRYPCGLVPCKEEDTLDATPAAAASSA